MTESNDIWLGSTYSRVILLLVGLVSTLGVADLGLEVVDVLGDVVTILKSAQESIYPWESPSSGILPDAGEVRPLQVSVDIDLDHTVL
jgi:hypothetical protein